MIQDKCRMFAAVVPHAMVRDGIITALDPCRQHGWARKVRWIPRKNIHLTLRFFGETRHEQLAFLGETMAACVKKRPAFDVSLDTLRAWPHPARARILAVTLKPSALLDDLAEALEAVATGCGFKPEKKRFLGHVTVGRCKHLDLRRCDMGLDFSHLTMVVDRVELIHSVLTPTGAVYRRWSSFDLCD